MSVNWWMDKQNVMYPYSRIILFSNKKEQNTDYMLIILSKGSLMQATYCSSVQFSRSVMSDSLRPRESQHARLPCPSPTPWVHPNSCPLSQWCHPAISSSVVPFSSCLQSFPESGSLLVSQLFASGGQSIRVSASASVLPVNTQDWSPLGWTGWISLPHLNKVSVRNKFLELESKLVVA